MKELKPFCILTLSTTGLSEYDRVTSVYMIKFDGKVDCPLDAEKLEILIDFDESRVSWAKGAKEFNEKIIKLKSDGVEFLSKKDALSLINESLSNWSEDGFIQLAGNNVGSFSAPFLERFLDGKLNIKKRYIDVGNLYFESFGYVPTLNEILELEGMENPQIKSAEDSAFLIFDVLYKRLVLKGN
ncbi:MAG: hypothetical protein H6622_13365 [Halobacteriovoraceae bacterium]|nr:hypothetical protein [Halobacteriovoraceae bacterium]